MRPAGSRAVVHLRAAGLDGHVQAVLFVGAVGQRLVEAAVRGLRLPVGGEDHLVLRERGAAANRAAASSRTTNEGTSGGLLQSGCSPACHRPSSARASASKDQKISTPVSTSSSSAANIFGVSVRKLASGCARPGRSAPGGAGHHLGGHRADQAQPARHLQPGDEVGQGAGHQQQAQALQRRGAVEAEQVRRLASAKRRPITVLARMGRRPRSTRTAAARRWCSARR